MNLLSGYWLYHWIIISKIGIDNIILKGGDQNTLSYGLGLVDNGVDLHQNKYNIVIAGHRDTHFNKLKSVNIMYI